MDEKKLYDQLTFKPKHANEIMTDELKKSAFDYCEGYKDFLDRGKTEREAASEAKRQAEAAGFVLLDSKDTLAAGDKVYAVNRGKAIVLAVIGKNGIDGGINMVGAHIDSPRLDLKQRPLFEDESMAWLKTHYYGGIKKYHWATLPLAMHGVVCRTDGSTVNINIGEQQDDPVFTITDLLPHLSQEQMEKKLSKAFNADNFHVLCGSLPMGGEDVKEKVKFQVLALLKDKYGITEEDFTSAEIELVPAHKARDVGFDRGIVGAYGQDDRVCAYAALRAILSTAEKGTPDKTAVCLLVDKEEIGSAGNTGMKSRFFELFLGELVAKLKGSCDALTLNRILFASKCLSADVGAAYDPQFPEVSDKRNSAIAGCGVLVTKYTGSRGKADSNDANPEFISMVRDIFNKNGVLWQTGELGKVDVGGGGTIAQYVANLGMEVLDCGTPLLSMHSPFELANKFDAYMTYKAYHAFFVSAK